MTPGFKSSCTFLSLDGKKLVAAELAIAFGCSIRMLQYYFASDYHVPADTRRTLAYMLRHGLLPETAKAIRERRARDGRRK
jgi:hypothetical protein